MNQEEMQRALSDAVLNMEDDAAEELAREAVALGHDAYEAIEKGLADGMERAGVLFEEGDYFVPELLLCSDAMYRGLEVLKPHIARQDVQGGHKVVLGVVEGDTHDIGKNLVKIMMEAAGFEVVDLGRDVPAAKFVEEARINGAAIIMASTLMTTTMDAMKAIVDTARGDASLKSLIFVGGGPVSKAYADSIGADGYAVNANEAVRLSKRMLGIAQ